MTKHTDTSHSTDSGVSGNAQTGAREIRAKEWLEAQRVFVPFYRLEMEALLAKYAESECSRLASRVEELERALHEIMAVTNPACFPQVVDAVTAYSVAKQVLAVAPIGEAR